MKSVAGGGIGHSSPGESLAQTQAPQIFTRHERPIAILCQPMPDELAIGHLGRIMFLNGISTIDALSRVLNGTQQAGGLTGQRAFQTLVCAAAGIDFISYGFRHSLNPFQRNVWDRSSVAVKSVLHEIFRGQMD